MSERPTVMIVEDDPPTRAYLAASVSGAEDLDLVGEVGTVSEGKALVEKHQPAVLLVDLALPDGSGLEIIRTAKEKSPGTLSLVITVFGDEQSVLSAIAAGAQGYLLKDSTARRIAESIRDLLLGGAPISPPIARHLLLRFQEPAPAGSKIDTDSRSEARSGSGSGGDGEGSAARTSASLSARETEVLELVVKGFTFPEIAEVLSISTHTVTTHVRRIYRKLAVRSRSEAVYEALQQGIVSVEADSD